MTTTTMHVFSCYHHNLLIQFVLEFCIHKHQSCYTSYGCHQYLVQFPFIYACSSTCCSTIKVLSAMRIWLVTLHMTVILFVLWIEHKRVLKVSVFVFLLHIGWSEIQVWRTSVSTGTVTPEAIPAHHSWHIHTFPLMQLPLLAEHTIHMAPIPEDSRVIYSVFGLLWTWK